MGYTIRGMANNEIVSGFDDGKDESLKITLEKVEGLDDCLILYLTGYIDTYNANSFQKRVVRVIEEGFIRLIFQCGSLNYVSSAGIGAFTFFLETVKPKGGDLVLLEIQPKVLEAFQLLGISQSFNIKGSIVDSVKFFKGGAGSSSLSSFPKVFECPVCQKKLKALKPGRFRCSECKSILAIDDAGQVFLG